MEDDTFKHILQDKQFHLKIKAEQKEIIQNVLERKDSMAECYQQVICNSLLLLKSLPINIINCIKFYVNCSALAGAYDWQ